MTWDGALGLFRVGPLVFREVADLYVVLIPQRVADYERFLSRSESVQKGIDVDAGVVREKFRFYAFRPVLKATFSVSKSPQSNEKESPFKRKFPQLLVAEERRFDITCARHTLTPLSISRIADNYPKTYSCSQQRGQETGYGNHTTLSFVRRSRLGAFLSVSLQMTTANAIIALRYCA